MTDVNEHPYDITPEDESRPTVVDESPTTAPSDDATPSPDATAFRRRRRMRIAAMTTAAVVIFGAGAGGGALAVTALRSTSLSTTAIGNPSGLGSQSGTGGSGSSSGQDGSGFSGFGSQGGFGTQGGFGPGSGTSGSGTSGSTSTSSGTAATTAQTTGVVTIVSTLKYEQAEAAGTGIILTSSGYVLTNNHVIEGSTSIEVTDELTGKSYTATVVGTDATHDIAVLKLSNASGLKTATLAKTAAAVGDSVTAVGNAGGTGSLTQASGTVAALNQGITTQAEGSAESEHLTGLIETSADVVSGDSGGPLLNSSGEVVGIDTAASSGSSTSAGYAITIAKALRIADDIMAGNDTSDITIGYPAFLGVELATSSTGTDGAAIGAVISGTPAASAGLAKGDTITKVGSTTISSSDDLHTAIATYRAGDSVTVTYTDTTGASHTATVTLIQGPAD